MKFLNFLNLKCLFIFELWILWNLDGPSKLNNSENWNSWVNRIILNYSVCIHDEYYKNYVIIKRIKEI